MAKFFSHFDWFIDWWTSRWSSILTCKKHFWLSFHQQHRHGEKMQGVNYHFHKATTQKANCTQWQSLLGVHFTFLFSLYIISRWVNILIECCSQSCISPSDRTDQSSQILVGEPRQKALETEIIMAGICPGWSPEVEGEFGWILWKLATESLEKHLNCPSFLSQLWECVTASPRSLFDKHYAGLRSLQSFH